MNKIKWNQHTVIIDDSIEDLPITRFNLYNLNLMKDAGIGSDLQDFDKRVYRVLELMKTDYAKGAKELINMQQAVHFVMKNVSPKMLAFVALIRKIDGREITDTDLSEEGCQDIINELGQKRFTIRMLKDHLFKAKKKIDSEFNIFFPDITSTPAVKQFYSSLLQRSLLLCRSIQYGFKPFEQQIQTIDFNLFDSIKPRVFSGQKGVEVTTIKGFEKTCAILQQNDIERPRSMTTLAYYEALAVVKAQIKQKMKS